MVATDKKHCYHLLFCYRFTSEGLGKATGWINHDVYNKIRNRFGEEGAQKFIDAMNKGIVNANKENGIKMFSGNGVEIGNTFYKYEIKILGKYGDWRVFGNYDEASGQIIFTLFQKGLH